MFTNIRSIMSTLSKSKGKAPSLIRDVAVKSLYQLVSDYSDWYEEGGLLLPPAYEADPSEWTEALHKMKNAFRLLYGELHGEGELWQAKNSPDRFGEQGIEKIEGFNSEIREGLTLFGANLFYLTDPQAEDTSE